jgi:CheY-like chemotaxis protein
MSISKILVVDDDPINCTLLSNELQRGGYIVVTANDAESGIELFKTESPDLVLIDLVMSDIDGYTAAREIKLISRKFIPIFFLSSLEHPTEKKLLRFFEYGENMIPKPIEYACLMPMIHVTSRIIEDLEGYNNA